MISIIAAIANNNVIGLSNSLPWHLPLDLQHFKTITAEHSVIMGGNTFDSILSSLGRPLPNRQNIVLSSGKKDIPGVLVAGSLAEALAQAISSEIFVIGGASVYRQVLPIADKMYLTEIIADIDGDVFFPDFDRDLWQEESRVFCQHDAQNVYDLYFVTLIRKITK